MMSHRSMGKTFRICKNTNQNVMSLFLQNYVLISENNICYVIYYVIMLCNMLCICYVICKNIVQFNMMIVGLYK